MFFATETLFAFVSTGAEQKMYTLRTLDKGYIIVKGMEQTAYSARYIKNLSTDLVTAIKKAKASAAANGIPFKLTPDSDKELFDIERLTPEQLDHRNWERLQAKLKAQDEKDAKAKELHDKLAAIEYSFDSEMNFGKYKNRNTIKNVIKNDIDYIYWLYENNELPFTQLTNHLQSQLNWIYANVSLPERIVLVSEYTGSIGEKLTITATCKRLWISSFEPYWGVAVVSNNYIMSDESGNIFNIKYGGNKWSMEENKTYTFTGKVKSHEEYKGVKQTCLNYVGKVKEI